MKNTFKIANVVFGSDVETNGYNVQLVNINLMDSLQQFKVNEDGEKELKEVRQFTIRLSEFTRLLILDEWLALVPENKLTDEQKALSNKERLSYQYDDQLRVLRGAEVTINREEIYEDELDDDGNPVLDDEKKPKKTLIGFGETSFVSLRLSAAASQIAQTLALKKLN